FCRAVRLLAPKGEAALADPPFGHHPNVSGYAALFSWLPVLLKRSVILPLRKPSASTAPRAMIAMIRPYSTSVWPDSWSRRRYQAFWNRTAVAVAKSVTALLLPSN